MRKRIAVFAAALVAVTLLIGCEPEVREVVVTQVVEKEVVVTEVVEVEGEQVEVTRVVKEEVMVEVTPTPPPLPEGGWVTEVSYADAEILNPLLSTDDASSIVHELLFGKAVNKDPFTGELIPDLVTHWDVSEDGQTYTFADGQSHKFSSEEAFMMGLYWGTESSREAIRQGWNATDQDVMMVLMLCGVAVLSIVTSSTWYPSARRSSWNMVRFPWISG